MITTINEFKQYINEVRLPHGYFKVTMPFSLPEKEGETVWDIMFNKDNIVEIDTVKKVVKRWTRVYNNASGSNASGTWTSSDFPYLDLMQPEHYAKFKAGTVKLAAEETPSFAAKDDTAITQFTTTVKRFNKKASELGLEENDKIKVVVL